MDYTYKSKIGNFEGPLGLLLSLIEERKLFINDVSLAEVTQDYLNYIKNFNELNVEKKIADVSYFILVASTLILIKSKSLLPNLELTEDEEEKIVDLEKRLKLYQIIKRASIDIKKDFGTKIIFGPLEKDWDQPLFVPDININIKNINDSILKVIANLPVVKENLPEIGVKKIININEVIEDLIVRIEGAINISFREFSKSHEALDKNEAKINIIVSFLAMLELARGGLIDVIQNTSFGEIEMVKQKVLDIKQE